MSHNFQLGEVLFTDFFKTLSPNLPPCNSVHLVESCLLAPGRLPLTPTWKHVHFVLHMLTNLYLETPSYLLGAGHCLGVSLWGTAAAFPTPPFHTCG